MRWFRKLCFFFSRPYKTLESRLVSYDEANRLIIEDDRWHINTPLEDRNPIIGMVFMEKREYMTEEQYLAQ